MAEIAQRLGRPTGSCRRVATQLNLPQKKPLFFCIFSKSQRFYFKLPLRPGIEKLLKRVDRLVEWVDEGRDNYELARAFHVPNPDVAYVVRRLGLKRPHEEAELEPEELVRRACLCCAKPVFLTRFRFRCDECLEAASGDDPEYIFSGVIGEHTSI